MKKAIIFLNLFFTISCFAQGDIAFAAGSRDYHDVINDWTYLTGSHTFKSQKYPDYAFNAVVDIGLNNSGSNDCSAILQNFIDGYLANPIYYSLFNDKTVLIYFPAGTYRFETTITINSRGKLIFKG